MTSFNNQRENKMKTIKSLIFSTVVVAVSSTAGAQGMDPSMMQQYSGGMTPQQMQQMQQQRMQNGMPMGGQGMMPMQQRHGCMAGQGGMMNHQKMQGMMQMRQQHMSQMEQRLDKIEAMLAELLQLQKRK